MFGRRVFAVLAAILLFGFASLPGHTHDDDCINYISLGTDEYELFGLSKSELEQRFKGRLEFDWANNCARPHSRTRFLLTFDDKKISAVQRTLMDPAGCNLTGPYLTSKKQAIQYAIDSLSNYGKLSATDAKRLADAKSALAAVSTKSAGEKHL
jgi:hypothetical protein